MHSRWLFTLPLALLVGWLFHVLHVPAGWILAGVVCGGATALVSRRPLLLHNRLYQLACGTIGVLAGVPLVELTWTTLKSFLLPGVLVAVATVIFSFAAGIALSRHTSDITPDTGIMSMLAGGASFLPALARELGSDFQYVTLTQYLRLLCVTTSLPLITHLFPKPDSASVIAAGNSQLSLYGLLIYLLIIVAAQPVGKWLHIPAPAILAPMLAAILAGLALPADISVAPPALCADAAFLAVGLMCGGSLSVDSLRTFARELPVTFLLIATLMAGCAALSWPLTVWLNITYFEAYLATTPGAVETVLALGSEHGAGAVVVAIQVIRIVVVLGIGGYMPQIMRALNRRSSPPQPEADPSE